MKKLALITASAMFALGAAQIATAANALDSDGNKFNFPNGNAFAFGHDKVKEPGQNNGLGNAFGHLPKAERNGNAFGLQDRIPNGNAFGHLPQADRPVAPFTP